jgi:chemotaxis protein methyltransferase CheR
MVSRASECTRFLQDVLPRLGLRWAGFRKVRRLVCKRIGKRLRELGLADLSAYRDYLDAHADEWRALDTFCRIPISRLYRDRVVFEALKREVLPALAKTAAADGRSELTGWSAGCASGEEPHTLAILWQLSFAPLFPALRLRVIGTDVDSEMLERARLACYRESSLRELPDVLVAEAVVQRGEAFCVKDTFRTAEFLQQDIRTQTPDETFDVILCRNNVLTDFAPDLQRAVMASVLQRLRPGGALVIGIHESLPEGVYGLEPWPSTRAIYRLQHQRARTLIPPSQ